jgi:hypothetical protein
MQCNYADMSEGYCIYFQLESSLSEEAPIGGEIVLGLRFATPGTARNNNVKGTLAVSLKEAKISGLPESNANLYCKGYNCVSQYVGKKREVTLSFVAVYCRPRAVTPARSRRCAPGP